MRSPLAWGLSAVVFLTGCGGLHAFEKTEVSPVTPSATSSPSESLEEGRLTAVCRAGDSVAVGRSPVDSGLGHRYLRIDVRNCTSRSLTLERPVLTGLTGGGRSSVLRLAVTPVADRSDEPFVLARGDTASAGVEWLAEPRGRRVVEMTVATGAQGDRADLVRLSALEIRLVTRLDYYPWVSQPDGVF